LAAIDRSKYKEKIIAYAISLGKTWGAEVTATHFIDPGRDEESDTVEKAIIDYAKKNNIGPLLIGIAGMSVAEEIFLVSVANNVIHHAHCPVFVIH
jgi:nucleotide-binding universal stress UspA family protein